MGTTPEYIEYVCDQVRGPWELRSRKMFGEYMVYVDEKPLLLICGNTVFVKKLPQIAELMAQAESSFPYDGAKEHWVLDVDSREHAHQVVAALEAATPPPQPKRPRRPKRSARTRPGAAVE
ncbi:MAG: hypothetical protein LBJ44_06750 [Propionibacteriaceae bacterium]|jgi:TfoX/Sxy family transcriptional regulator of competence genes|nr:hypothetical protein [Propionibacteriaceae bacterium]